MSYFGNLLVLIGENYFKVYHNDTFVEDFKYDRMGHFEIRSKDSLVSANEDGITSANYILDPPVILCHKSGSHKGVISTLVRIKPSAIRNTFRNTI